MMDNDYAFKVFLSCLLASPMLWLISLYLLRRWSHFPAFFAANTALLIVYLYVLFHPTLISFGHDEYGLGRLFGLFCTVTAHVVLGFLFAVAFRWKRRAAMSA
ncbi:hypothetical protein F0P96_12745 [Hymenobacter busanensis]|uniref:Uncharacterized protein n=1 Tax=Hymenobacter busanensis TaxID=2607656 RepID=A0A7L4ZWE3_9BACT|nr:hypothetical protein [Hymenobacter busanensis]KAA9332340.1 hypothetical protein F0P96_12745 [Hymenobacter busanensis]QHJ07323.1 hypothetical protein GUY19_08530 [Hymenobacter busanensis]